MLKNLKSLFIIEDEPASKAEPQKPEEKAGPAGEQLSAPAAAPGQVRAEFTDVLFQAMERANVDGFDYLEFKKALQNLAKMDMDEATRYRSAFAMAQTMNATPDSLVSTAGHYLSALQREEQQFEQALAKQEQQRIGARRQQLEQLEQEAAAKSEQISRLQAEIDALQEQQQEIRQSIREAATRVEQTKNDFIVSYERLVNQIRSDIEKMRQYLK